MGYFDALTDASFKKTTDGKMLFYPYGTLGHGYVIPTETEFDQLHRNYKYIWVATLIIIFAAVWSLFSIPILSLLLLAGFIIFYMIWVRVRCRNLARSSEKLTYKEAITNETRGFSSRFLWVFEILSILFMLYGFLLLIVDPNQRLLALLLIVVFGACSVIYARMIRIKHRQTQQKQ